MNHMQIYQQLAQLVDAYQRCVGPTANESQRAFAETHRQRIEQIVKDYMPSGSGIDQGTTIDLDAQSPERLAFYAPFHHMNEGGMYDGWTYHTITVRPSLGFGFRLSISGTDKNEIKDYLHSVFAEALSATYNPEKS